MEVKICPFCKEEINKDAKKCPKCQWDLRNWFVKHWILTTISILIIISIVNSWSFQQWVKDGYKEWIANSWTTNIQTNEMKVEEVIKVSSFDLVNDYTKNEISADEKYKGKIVEVNWTIDSIAKDILDNPYITLVWKDFNSVQCMLKDKNQWASATKWEIVNIKWKVSWKMMNILINDCEILN